MSSSKPKTRRARRRRRRRAGSGRPPAEATQDPATSPPSPGRRTRNSEPKPATRRAPRSEAPPPIWAPLPVTETLLAVGMLTVVTGLLTELTGLILGGVAMIVISSSELAFREHLAGYRSHTSLLATVLTAAITLGLAALLNVTDVGLPIWPLLIVAVASFVGLFVWMRKTFKRRSAGFGFRA